MSLKTEYEFTLPKGYVDSAGKLHRKGVMRLATARDEIEPLRDKRVMENEAYLTVIILSRVVTQLGTVSQVTPKVVEELFAADLAYLQDLYGVVNFGDPEALKDLEGERPFAESTVEEVGAAAE
jgi:hypothetical protein